MNEPQKKLFSALSVSLFHALGNTFRWSMQEKKMPTFAKDMHDIARASEWAQPNAGTTSTIFLSLILARTYKHNNGIYIHIHIHTHTQLIHSYDIFSNWNACKRWKQSKFLFLLDIWCASFALKYDDSCNRLLTFGSFFFISIRWRETQR